MARGLADHRPYAQGAARLAYGLSPAGRLVHVRDAERGAACNCVCPACDRPLVARRAKTWHFAHQPGAECPRAYETMLHRLAKEVLEENLALWTPAVRVEGDGVVHQPFPARSMSFESARLETWMGQIVPDIVVTYRGHELIVEIFVTHACDEAKITKLRDMGLAAVEIDLSKLPRDADRAQVAKAVTKSAPRRWLYNPKLDEAVVEHRRKVEAAEQERLAKLGRQADRFAQHWERLQEAQPLPPDERAKTLIARAQALELKALIGLKATGDRAFAVEPRAWQAELVEALIISPPTYWGPVRGVSVTQLAKDLRQRGQVAALLQTSPTREMDRLIRQRRADFATPESLIRGYLTHLAKQGLLLSEKDVWRAAPQAQQQVKARRIELAARRDRLEDLEETLDDLLDRAGVDASAFDAARWRRDEHPVLGASPFAIAHAGGEAWRDLERQLQALRAAFHQNGDDPGDLGLPVLPAIHAARQARAEAAAARRREDEARRAAEADAREAAARRTAESLLRQPEAFLFQPCAPGRPIDRLTLARASNDGLWTVQRQIEQEYERREAEAQRVNEANTAVSNLRRLAANARGEDWAEVFLHSTWPELGHRRPIDVCVDLASQRRCERLISGRRRG
jgi:hypothetical protein